VDFSTSIQGFNQEFNLNAIKEYNKYLQGNESFKFESDTTEFGKALEAASKSVPVKDKRDPIGLGNFADTIGASFGGGLNAVNNARIQADKMQEDLAMGGATSIHDAMIAAEKAELSMQMAIQVRNRILNAYTELTQMSM
jgi:flagellar hook-basal body complex protein FliE